MKIGMVTACYKPMINGVTRMIDLYKERLEQEGHEVTVFTLGEPDLAGDDPHIIRSPAWPLGDTGYYAAVRHKKEAQIQLGQMDIIHCHHLFMSLEFAHRYGQAPIVYTNHTRYDLYADVYVRSLLPFLPETAIQHTMRYLWPKLTNLSDAVISPSASVRRVMREFGVSRPIHVIENGVDLKPFSQPSQPLCKQTFQLSDDDLLAVYVGRLSPEKNLPVLIDEFIQAQRQRPHIHLLLIGDGPLTDKLQEQINAAALQKNIHFIGAIPSAEVPNYLAAADLFVTASVSEVHPLTVIEGMAAGLPIVGRAAPGLTDCVTPGRSGLLVSTEQGALAQAIIHLSDYPHQRQQMSHAAQQESQHFDIERTTQATLALYEELLASHTPAADSDERYFYDKTK